MDTFAGIILSFLGFLLAVVIMNAIGYVIVKVFQWFKRDK